MFAPAPDLVVLDTGRNGEDWRLLFHPDLTYELLSEGNTIGVFQLESPPMRQLLKAMAPNSFEDVSAVLALYRPGPMSVNMHYDYADRMNGRQEVSYFHDDAVEVLGDTYGLMIYQESVMRVAQKFAGYSLAEADNLRKACGKKIREAIAEERPLVLVFEDLHWADESSLAAVRAVAEGRSETPRGWILPSDNRDPDAVRRLVEEIRAELPPGVGLDITSDRSDIYRQRVVARGFGSGAWGWGTAYQQKGS